MEPQPKRARIDESNHDSTENKVETSRDLYLDTINRHMLDFDFEKLCSVSLSPMNVYACLVCGKYYQGALHTKNMVYGPTNDIQAVVNHRMPISIVSTRIITYLSICIRSR